MFCQMYWVFCLRMNLPNYAIWTHTMRINFYELLYKALVFGFTSKKWEIEILQRLFQNSMQL